MFRHVAAVIIVVLCLGSSSALAQSADITIKVAAAEVHVTPSLGSPVIGHAPRGMVLQVTREVGDWVKVSWPQDKGGVGYVLVNEGTLGHRGANGIQPPQAAQPAMSMGQVPSAPAPVQEPPSQLTPGAPAGRQYTVPLSHRVGVGGLMSGSDLGFGVSGRGWWHNHVGVQVALSRISTTSPFLPTHVTSTEFSPSVMYSFPDAVTDDVWIRPYAGGGLNLRRQRFGSETTRDLVSDSYYGMQLFGGAEFSIAGAPRLALSADIGYRSRSQFVGMELGGMGFTLAGHWYIR